MSKFSQLLSQYIQEKMYASILLLNTVELTVL